MNFPRYLPSEAHRLGALCSKGWAHPRWEPHAAGDQLLDLPEGHLWGGFEVGETVLRVHAEAVSRVVRREFVGFARRERSSEGAPPEAAR